MKKFVKLVSIGILIGVILLVIDKAIQYFSTGVLNFQTHPLLLLGYYVMYSLPLCIVNAYFFDYIYHKIYWNKYKRFKIITGVIGSVFATLISITGIRLFHKMILENNSYQQFLQSERLEFYIISIVITLVVTLFFHAVFFYRELQKNKIKEQKVIAGTASAKFDALKNQLDPHFLFNSLNVLSSLIDENPNSAQKFTTALSKVYRYVLEQKNKELVTVDEELKFAKTYMSLLKMRFEDSIIFDIPEKASNPESKVIPLSLQLLLENAVKHNMVTSKNPLHIKIYELEGSLVVENNLQPKQVLKKSSGVGLSNIKQRYQLLTHKEVIINQKAKCFIVTLPMLTKQISIMRTSESTTKFADSYLRARKYVEELKGFYYSLASYFVVMPFLIFIWYKFTPFTIQWFWFPILGWGIGLVFQAYRVFVDDGAFGRKWEQRKIEQYMREEQNTEKWR